MKSIYFKILVLMLLGITCFGQEYIYPVNNVTEALTIEIQVGFTELRVSGTSENNVKIKRMSGKPITDERAEGLSPVTPWPDNTGAGIHISEKGNEIFIIKTNPRMKAIYEISVPDRVNLVIRENEWGRGDFQISGIKGNVNIESNSSDISIKNTGGSVEAETVSGNLEIELPPPGIGKKHEINSVSGTTNLLISKGSSYSLDLSTVSGSFFTEFELVKEIEYKGSKLRMISRPKEIITDLNGGGDKIEASTVSGLIDVSFKQ